MHENTRWARKIGSISLVIISEKFEKRLFLPHVVFKSNDVSFVYTVLNCWC